MAYDRQRQRLFRLGERRFRPSRLARGRAQGLGARGLGGGDRYFGLVSALLSAIGSPSCDSLSPMGSLKKKRRLKMNKHKRRKRSKENRHKKRLWG
jgi:hypothetical protein